MRGITMPDAIEVRHITGFPGIYGPGIVVPLEQTGLSEKEAADRIKRERLPLEILDIGKKAAMPAPLSAEPAQEPEPPKQEPEKGGE